MSLCYTAVAHSKSWTQMYLCLTEVLVFVLQGDNLRVRALDNMMGGSLVGKKEDVLKMVGHNIHTLF